MTLPSKTFGPCPVWANMVVDFVSVGGGKARNASRLRLRCYQPQQAELSSESNRAGEPGGYGL